MRHETFRGRDIATVHALAQRAFGDDALIVATRAITDERGRTNIEVDAVPQDDLVQLAQLVRTPQPLRPRGVRPAVIALVGPTGAGKTTTVAKLANHPQAFGGHAVGLLGLDTYRVGAIEQSRIYAELSRLPLEVVYEAGELPRAMRRLAGCDVVLVDTAGRGPRSRGDSAATRAMLSGLEPLEVHLTLPAGLQPRLARRVVDDYRGHGLTHLLPTKLDEFPEDTSFFELSAACGLPVRWLTDGQEVPADLRLAQGFLTAAPRVAPRAWAETGAA